MVKGPSPPHGPPVPSQSLPTMSRTSPPSTCTLMFDLQCPQASMSLLMLFPLSGMPFLHVLLMPLIFSSGIISSRKSSWTSSLPCWVRCPSLGQHGLKHILHCLWLLICQSSNVPGSLRTRTCGSSLNLQNNPVLGTCQVFKNIRRINGSEHKNRAA